MSKEKNKRRELDNLAVQNHQNNNLQDAQNYYQKVLKIDPIFQLTYSNLGIVYKILAMHQKAKDCYEKAIEINPDYAPAYRDRGNLFEVLGKNQIAKDCYEKAIEINPDYAPAYHESWNNI